MQRAAATLILCLPMSVALSAEVMDKIPTIAANWLYAVINGGLAILAWRWRWWFGVGFSVLWLSGLWLIRQEIADPAIASSILLEAGQRYFAHFYSSVLVAFALQAAAIYVAWRGYRSPNASR